MKELMRLGDSGESEKEVQNTMGMIVDGIFGIETEYMVKELQYICDIDVTGIIDAETHELIFGNNVNKTEEPCII